MENNTEIVDLISSDGFQNVPKEIQEKALNSITNRNQNDGGIMGKLFGNKKENATLNIAFMICVLLTIVGVLCMMSGNEKWDVIIPTIMTAVGYMFGAGVKK